jgi:hypothetical protein
VKNHNVAARRGIQNRDQKRWNACGQLRTGVDRGQLGRDGTANREDVFAIADRARRLHAMRRQGRVLDPPRGHRKAKMLGIGPRAVLQQTWLGVKRLLACARVPPTSIWLSLAQSRWQLPKTNRLPRLRVSFDFVQVLSVPSPIKPIAAFWALNFQPSACKPLSHAKSFRFRPRDLGASTFARRQREYASGGRTT